MARSVTGTRMTYKLHHAEIKNRHAEERLSVLVRSIEKEQNRNIICANRKKLKVIDEIQKMRITTGKSVQGVPMEGPNDTAHFKSPYSFGMPGYRRRNWRRTEIELETLIKRDAKLFVPPWEWDSDRDISKHFAKMMRMLGYDVGNDDMVQAKAKKNIKQSGSNIHFNKIDVFQTLRKESTSGVQSGDSKYVFSVKKWEADTAREYSELVARPGSKQRTATEIVDFREDKSRQHLQCAAHRKNNSGMEIDLPTKYDRSQNSSEVSIDSSLSNLQGRFMAGTGTGTGTGTGRRSKVRPHTAQCVRSVQENKKPDTSRPQSAHLFKGIDRENNSISIGASSSYTTSSEDLEISQRNGRLMWRGQKVPVIIIHSPEGILLPNSDSDHSISMKLSSGKCQHHIQRTEDILSTDDAGLISRIYKSIGTIALTNKNSCILSGIDMRKLEKKLENISELVRRVPSLMTQPSPRRLSWAVDPQDAYHVRSTYAEMDPLDEVIASEDSESENDFNTGSDVKLASRMQSLDYRDKIIGKVPRWSKVMKSKKMAEIMKLKEMEFLLSKYTSNIREINARENARKIYSRLHLYFTMLKLDEAVAAIVQ